MFVPGMLKMVGQELCFTGELTLDLACRFGTQNIFSFFPLPFLCYALNFMTVGVCWSAA